VNERRKRPRICFVGLTQRRSTLAFGGAPVVVVNLANYFVRRGFPVDVLLFTRRSVTDFPFRFEPEVEVHPLLATSRLVLQAQVTLHLLRSRPARILAVGTKANVLAAWATRLPGISAELWATQHHSLSSEMAGWKPAKRRRRVRQWRWVLSRSAGLIAVSRGVAEDFATATGLESGRLHVIYNPIVDAALVARMRKPAAHPWLADGGPPVILGVGRLTEQKDFATLIGAFAAVRGRRACRLLIIGEGEERERLQALAAMLGVREAVDLTGFEPNPMPFMREARLLVMSSRWEGFGNVLVEALYCGTPVVSTDCPHGPREVLADGSFGRLVPVGDVSALAAAIADALDEDPDRRRLRARALEFSVEASGDRYLELMGLR